MRLEARFHRPEELTAAQRDAMFALLARHYDRASREAFERDLDEKHWVIWLCEPGAERLCGFSTQMVLDRVVDGRPIRALFSGDTIVNRSDWGTNALAIAWGQLATQLVRREPDSQWYWFLICKGFRTYRFLSVFFDEFYPRCDRPTPLAVQSLLDALAADKFPAAYDREAGVVRADRHDYVVRPEIGEPPPGRLDRHVAYFLERNPGYREGDELCCLAPLAMENFSAAARRLMATPAFASADVP
jgi:hypothetical protein